MVTLDVLTVAACAAIVFVAFVVRGASGFGTSLIAMPLLVYVLPIHAAVPMMTLLALGILALLGVRDRTHVVWPEMWRMLGPTLLGVVAGVYLFSLLESRAMMRMLGAFIVGYALYMVAAEFMRGPLRRCGSGWAYPASFACSFVDSMFGGGGGLLLVIYMNRRGYDKVPFRATLAVLWLLELIVRVIGYSVAGYYDSSLLWLVALLVPAMLLGNRVGERITRGMSPQAFSRLLAVLLLASGGSLLVK